MQFPWSRLFHRPAYRGVMRAKAMAWSLIAGWRPHFDAMARNPGATPKAPLCPRPPAAGENLQRLLYRRRHRRNPKANRLPGASPSQPEEKARAFSGPKYWFGDAPLEVESGIVVTGGSGFAEGRSSSPACPKEAGEREKLRDPRAPSAPLFGPEEAAKP